MKTLYDPPTNLRQSLRNVALLLEKAVAHYETHSPQVAAYLDDLYVRLGKSSESVCVPELLYADGLDELRVEDWIQPNLAQNQLLKLLIRLKRDTTGISDY